MRNKGPRSWNNNGPRFRYNGPHYNFANSGPEPAALMSFHMNAPPGLHGLSIMRGGGRGRGFQPPHLMRPTPMPLFPEGGPIPLPRFISLPSERYRGPPFPSARPSMMYRGHGPPARGGMKRKRGSGVQNSQPNKTFRADGEYQCDTCDRNYETRELLDEHFATHRKCDINGCNFMAHPKIVELHVKMQHETGLADKIMHLNSEEDIAKWKSERRRNFPSAENVARRQAEQAGKLARGELLKDKQFGKFNNTRGRRGRGGCGFAMNKPVPSGQSPLHSGTYPMGIADPGYISFEDEPPKAKDQIVQSPRRGRFVRGRGRGRGRGHSRRPFRGKGRATANETGSVSRGGIAGFAGTKDAPVSVTIVSANNEQPTGSDSVANGNYSLAGSGLSDYSDSDAPVELPSKPMPEVSEKQIPRLPGALASLVAAYESSENEDCIKSRHSSNKSPRNLTTQRASSYTRKQSTRPIRTPKPTLLEMLLAKEIRHERNVILQCVRYTVQNNFFDALQMPA